MTGMLKMRRMLPVAVLLVLVQFVYAQDLAGSDSACSSSWNPPWKGTMAGERTASKDLKARFELNPKDPAGILGNEQTFADPTATASKAGVPGWLLIGFFFFLALLMFIGGVELFNRFRGGRSRHSSHRSSDYRRNRSPYSSQ